MLLFLATIQNWFKEIAQENIKLGRTHAFRIKWTKSSRALPFWTYQGLRPWTLQGLRPMSPPGLPPWTRCIFRALPCDPPRASPLDPIGGFAPWTPTRAAALDPLGFYFKSGASPLHPTGGCAPWTPHQLPRFARAAHLSASPPRYFVNYLKDLNW